MTLHLGLARADITPPVGIPMVGFAGRDDSTDVHDPLTATALLLVDAGDPLLLVCMDLLQLTGDTVATCRQAMATASGVPAERIMLACAHNHYGPNVDRGEGRDVVDAYRHHLLHVLAGLAQRAAAAPVETRLGVGWGASDIGINRRERRSDGQIVLGNNPDGPVDRDVGVARFDAPDGTPLAVIAHFACHPVCQGSRMTALSADYPGSMRHVVESLAGAPCLFLQGAGANINPIRMEHAYEPARTLGTRLGCEVARVWETIEPRASSGVAAVTEWVELPGYRYGSEANARALREELRRQAEKLEVPGASTSARYWTQARLERVEQVVATWSGQGTLEPVRAELQAWRIGELALTSAPGEIFNEIGCRVKQASPFRHTFFAAYANGSIGYVPVREAYPEGGYEVTHACRVDPEAGDLIADAGVRLLGQLGS